ncbi:uncharacterized protein LOC131212589 [Anopheles bellator]|uniref:uncharacterized protein LOC131212589 n=1 Tax=Anopheles bellator TaxID=139047 RepID=UPI0026498AAA|nr:uncharacterized protein LOC131212589 [Anopheles bellator]
MERRKDSANIVLASDRKKQEQNDTREVDDDSKQKGSQRKDAFTDVPKHKPGAYRCTIHHPFLEPTIRNWTGKNQNMIRKHTHHALLQLPLQPNVLTRETIFEHFEPEKRWHVGLPTPLYIAPETDGPTVPDLMVRFLRQKDVYSRKLRSTSIAYRHIKSKRAVNDRVASLNASGGMQNSAALVYAALLDRDPDPYLHPEATYDYHFTGGSCATLSTIDGRSRTTGTTVFKAIGESLAELEVMHIRCHKEEFKACRAQVCNTNIAGPILEILTVDDHPAGCFVLVRKRDTIVILREQLVENKSKPISRWVPFATIVSVVPFASVCAINPTALKHRKMLILCTTDYQRMLRLWTIECSKHNKAGDVQFVKQLKLPTKHNSLLQQKDNSPRHGNTSCKDVPRGQRCSDGWSTVRCVDNGSILACLDRDMVHLYRVESEDASPELLYCGGQNFSQWIYTCESHCALDVAPDVGLIFIATCHHLLVVRLASHEGAQSGSDSCDDAKPSLTVVIVFAHNLRQRPVFMHFLPYSFEEKAATRKEDQCFLLLASHLAMDYCICTINRQGTGDDERSSCKMVARQYPYRPRTVFDSYKLAQRQGHCLSAQQPLKRRLFACHSGACLVPFDDCLYVVLQNSCGDLLQQKISANTSERHREDATVPDVIRRWHDQLIGEQTTHHQRGHPPYKATDFRPLKRFRDIFNYPGKLSSDLVQQILPKKIAKKEGAKSMEPKEEEYFASSVASDTDFSDFETEVAQRSGRSNQKPLPWQQTIEQLQQYKDVLVSPLLEVWGYGIEAEVHHTIPTTLPPYNDVTERVDSWINSVSTTRRPSTDSNTSYNDNSNFDIESKLFTFTIDRLGSTTEPAENVDCKGLSPERQHPFVSSTPLETETRPKRKTYVKGF